MQKKESIGDIIKHFDGFGKEAGFFLEEISPEDEKMFQDIFNSLAEKKYTTVTLIGTTKDQMVGLSGNRSSLIYLLAKAMLKDEDLMVAVGSAMRVLQMMAIYSKEFKTDESKGKEELN